MLVIGQTSQGFSVCRIDHNHSVPLAYGCHLALWSCTGNRYRTKHWATHHTVLPQERHFCSLRRTASRDPVWIQCTQASFAVFAIDLSIATGHIEGMTIPGAAGDTATSTLGARSSVSHRYLPYRTFANIGTIPCIVNAILIGSSHHVCGNAFDRFLEKRRCRTEIAIANPLVLWDNPGTQQF